MYNKNFTRFIKISRILASVISIAGGYVFILKFVSSTVGNIIVSHIITAIGLSFIEMGSISMITVGFSYIYERKWKLYSVFIPIACLFLGISFLLTVNGSKEWVNIKKDQTEEISDVYKEKIEDNREKYTKLIEKYQHSYDSLISLGMHKYYSVRMQRKEDREHFTTRIAYYQDRLNKEEAIHLKNEEKDLNINIIETKETEYVYYISSGVIMLFVFIFNFLLVFMKYHKPIIEKEKIAPEIAKISLQESEISLQEKVQESEILQESESLTARKKIAPEINLQENKEEEVLKLKKEGLKQCEISEILGISESKVCRIIKKYNQKNKLL